MTWSDLGFSVYYLLGLVLVLAPPVKTGKVTLEDAATGIWLAFFWPYLIFLGYLSTRRWAKLVLWRRK